MKKTDDVFFDGKRPWSRVKDRVLGSYLPPYLRKVQRLGKPVVIVDCFAGRGTFSDGTPGSPLIICQQIMKHATGCATAYFVNKRIKHHVALCRTLKPFIDAGIARPVLGQSEDFLRNVASDLREQTVFVYLDPFGLKGCNFAATRRLLQRDPKASTEMLMTLSMPVLHRLAARRSANNPTNAIIPRFHAVLDGVLGSAFWRDIMFDTHLTSAQKEERVVSNYCAELQKYVRYTGCCPVRDADDARVKYYIIVASRHPHAILLMNDIMLNAYQDHTHKKALADLPLLAATLPDWKELRSTEQETLSTTIVQVVGKIAPITRVQLWHEIVVGNFMLYREAEFKSAVQQLVHSGTLSCDGPGPRLNDTSILRLGRKRGVSERAHERPDQTLLLKNMPGASGLSLCWSLVESPICTTKARSVNY